MRTFLVCLLACICLASAIKHENVAYFPGRSGDMIVTTNNIQDDSFIYIIENEGITREMSSRNVIEENSVADLVSHLIGTPVINENAARDALPKGNAFNKAGANLLMVVDSIGADEISKFSSELKVLKLSGKQMSLARLSYPQDNIATLATIMTGHGPSVHGIVNKEWISAEGVMSAYRSKALPQIASFVDVVSQTFDGRSLTIAASADYQMAAALGAHQFLQTTNPKWNNFAAAWSMESGAFDSLYSSDSPILSLSQSKLMRNLSSRQFSLPTRFNAELYLMTVFPQTGEAATFDLKKKQDFYFFAEIEYVHYIIEQLEADDNLKTLVGDNIPDLFNFAFSTLKGIKARYGSSSPHYRAAVLLLDGVLSDVISKLSQIYKNKLMAEIIFVSGQTAYDVLHDNEEARTMAYHAIKASIPSRDIVDRYFPAIFLTQDLPFSSAVCERLEKGLKDDMHVYCSKAVHLENQDYTFERVGQENNGTDTSPYAKAAKFHIILWFSIIFAIVLFASVYAMFTMDIGLDSMLYRLTSSNRKM